MATYEKSRHNKKQTREIRRLNLKIEMLQEDLEECQDVLCECEIDYSTVLSVLLGFFKKKKVQPPPSKLPDKNDFETDVDNIKSPPWVKKLFKKIAKETHPDKLGQLTISEKERSEKKKMYLDSLASINNGDFSSLVDTAVRLGIDTGLNHGDIRAHLEKKIKAVEEKIENIQSKFSWVWFHSDNSTRVFIIRSTCEAYGISPTEQDIGKIMKAIKEKDLTVLTSKRSERKVGQRPARIERK